MHLLRTTFGIPLGPGALKGLVLFIARMICSSVIGQYSKAGSLYSVSSSAVVCVCWTGGKKLLNSMLALPLLVDAMFVSQLFPFVLRVGILVRLLSVCSAIV